MSSAAEPGPNAAATVRRRIPRWVIVASAVLAVGFLSLVALAPTLVSSGLFRGRIIEAIGGNVNGTVSIAQVSVGWSGPLAARGVTVEDTATGNRLAADISLEQGLWTLITKGAERLDVRLSGSLRTRREADGSLSILRLLRERPAPPGGAAAQAPAAGGSGKPGLPRGIAHVAVTIDDLDLEVVEASGGTFLAVRDLAGAASVDAGQGASVRLAAKTEFEGAAGSIELKATLPGLFAADGSIALASAGADAELRATDVAIEAGGLAMRVSKATASVRAKQLTGRIDVALDVNAALDGAAPSAIAAELAIDRLLTADGGTVVDLSAIHGTLRVADLPTRPFERFAQGTGVVLARDLGPSVGLDARFADAAGGDLSVALRSERLSLTARGSVDPATRAANFPSIDADASLAPELLDALAQVTVTAPARLSLRARSVSIPAAAADGSVPVDALSFDADASLELAGLQVPGPEGRVPFGVTALRLSAKAAPVSAGIELSATADRAAGDGAQPMRIAARVRRGGALGAHGSLRVEQLPTALVRPFLPKSLPVDVERDVGPVVAAVDATVADGATPEIAVTLDSPSVRADLRATVAADGAIAVRPGGRIEAAPVRRALLAGFGVQADGDMAISVGIARLELPAMRGAADLSRAAADVELSVRPFARDPVGVTFGAGDAARTVRVADLRATVATAALGTDAGATLALRSDVAAVDATVGAKGLGDLSQASIERAELSLSAKASGVPSARIVAEVPALKDLLPHLGGAAWDAELSYRGSQLQGDGAAMLRSGTTLVSAKAALRESELSAEATAALDATPALVAAAAPGLPMELAAPARIDASVARASMKRPQRWSFEAPQDATATVRIAALEAAKVPGTKGNPVLAGLALEVRAELGARVLAKGTLAASLAARRAPAAPAAIAPLRGSFEWSAAEGNAPARWSADVALSPISADGLAALIDLDEAARREIGSGARIAAKASSADGGIAFELTSTLERLKAQVAGTLAGDELALSRSSVELALSAQQATELANAAGATPGPDGKVPPPAWKEVGPVAVQAGVESLRMRLGGGVRSAVVRVDAKPFPMVAADGQRISVDGVTASVDMPAPDRAATVRAATVLVGAGGRAPVSLDAQVAGWSAPDGSFSAESLRIDGALKAERASTAVLGVLLGMGAELGEALGPELTVDATAKSGAPGTATIAARASSRYATLDVPQVDLRAGMLSVAPAKPVTLDFLPSPPLRRRYLAPINPVFRDIRLADESKPIRLAVPMVAYPLDGNMARFDGDIRLTVGSVLLERNADNDLLNVLKIFQKDAKQDNRPVDGVIEPLDVAVRKGQLTYKDFSVGIERVGSGWRTRLIFDGDIDLTQKPPYARRIAANYPLSSLAREVIAVLPNEEGGSLGDALNSISLNVADAAQLRIAFRGPLGEVDGRPAKLDRRTKLVIDGSQLGKGVEEIGQKVGDALGDLFKKRKK